MWFRFYTQCTIHESSSMRRITLGKHHASDILKGPVWATVPKAGHDAVTPQRDAGNVIEPPVSEPLIANGTIPVHE